MLTIYCDGGARGNPGPAAAAYVVYEDGKVIHKFSKFLGKTTNNVAEYNALILALNFVLRIKPNSEVKIILDSQLVANQMKGGYKVKNKNLQKFFLTAKNLEKQINQKIIYQWSARVNNKLADELVNAELDEAKS
ncbi:ribonuclease HI family protein [Candidatus Woesebacteria bacterium]|nr:ribonuclease HI family protein [Candidatus Woesebacteria bacterium]